MRRTTTLVVLLLAAAACAKQPAGEQPAGEAAPTAAAVDPKADQLMRQMSDLLAKAPAVSFTADETRDVVKDGEKSQIQISRHISLQRPDRLRADFTIGGGEQKGSVWYDRGRFSVLGEGKKLYAEAAIPPTLDEALDFIGTRLEAKIPLADLLYSVPYSAYIGESSSGRYVGSETIDGVSTHHLAFQHPVIDFEIWLDDGAQPLPRQLVLTYKLDEGAPKSALKFRDWNLAPSFAADHFALRPPEGYARIPFRGQRPRAGAEAPAEPTASN